MRTTLTIDEDAHEFATIYAEANGITLSKAVSELLRKAQTAPAQASVPGIRRLKNGFPVFSTSSGKTITPEMVKRLEEEEFEP